MRTQDYKRTTGYFSNAKEGLYLPFQLNPFTLQTDKQTNYNTQAVPGYDPLIYFWANGGAKTISFEIMFDSTATKVAGTSLAGTPYNIFISGKNKVPSSIGNNAAALAQLANAGLGGVTAALDPLGLASTQVLDLARTTAGIVRGYKIGDSGNMSVSEALNLFKFKTIDNKDYNEYVGVLPQIATLEAFLRPRSTKKFTSTDLEQLFINSVEDDTIGSNKSFKSLFDLSENTIFTTPPECIFVYGYRVFVCKLMSAPITELVHNRFLVPERIRTTITLNVVETANVEDFNSDLANRQTITVDFTDDRLYRNPGSLRGSKSSPPFSPSV